MAAPSSKSSPSNKQPAVEGNGSNNSKKSDTTAKEGPSDHGKSQSAAVESVPQSEPSTVEEHGPVDKESPASVAGEEAAAPVSANNTAATNNSTTTTATTTTIAEPTYEGSEESEHYVTAKEYLRKGDFESALAAIVRGIEATKAALYSLNVKGAGTKKESDDHDGNDKDEDETPLHPAMAPFHYLYGTTLLYSIEESNDNQAMTVGGGVPGETVAADPSGDGEEGEDCEGDGGVGGDGVGGDGGGGGDGASPVEQPQQETTEDAQIAWENLDAARTTLEKMLQGRGNESDGKSDKLRLDLAQVHLREGDLQRFNGNYETAIRDYMSCLTIREGSPLLDSHDRLVADVHYNLGLAHMMLVAEAKAGTGTNGDAMAAAASSSTASASATAGPEKLAFHRGRSFHHFLSCAKSFSGQLAKMCGVAPEEFLDKALNDVDDGTPKPKSTGDDGEGNFSSEQHPKMAGLKLRCLRKHVAALDPPLEHREAFGNYRELLDEIQETVDEAETSEKGMHEVSEMKAEITAAVAGQQSPGSAAAGPFGGTASLFSAVGGATGNADAAVTTAVGFGTKGATAAGSVAAQPVMVVKKKKKKRDAEDAKMPALEGPTKRGKAATE